MSVGQLDPLESDIAEWRAFIARAPAIADRDVQELETHLRDQIDVLDASGLAADEAFLVAVKRLGSVDTLSGEFAREHRGRLWKQLVADDVGSREVGRRWPEALAFALGASVAVVVALAAAGYPDQVPTWLLRSAGFLVLPFLAGWFLRTRRQPPGHWWALGGAFAAAAVAVNVFPFADGSATEVLAATHLPVVLWFVVAVAFLAGDVRSHDARMDMVRFTGEWVIYYTLIALGGMVLAGLTVAILTPLAPGLSEEVLVWGVPSGAAAGVVVAAWLVEGKQQVVENMAPILTMLFTPLFAVMLVGAVIVYAVTGLGGVFDRDLLGVFDALLVVVLGLVLYGLSARDPADAPRWMDRIQLVVVVSALVLDGLVLATMVGRVGELGFTPNRTVALGLNLVLLVNLAGAAWLSARFVSGRGTLYGLERWQTSYLPVFGAWALVVVVLVPPLFSFS